MRSAQNYHFPNLAKPGITVRRILNKMRSPKSMLTDHTTQRMTQKINLIKLIRMQFQQIRKRNTIILNTHIIRIRISPNLPRLIVQPKIIHKRTELKRIRSKAVNQNDRAPRLLTDKLLLQLTMKARITQNAHQSEHDLTILNIIRQILNEQLNLFRARIDI